MSMDSTKKLIFQNDIIAQMEKKLIRGETDGYDRERTLYAQDALSFVQTTQPQQWNKFANIYLTDTERHFLDALVTQLKKADINATDRQSRTYGTLGLLRHGIKNHSPCFSLCQFKPEHYLNPDTLTRYKQNIFRIVPELIYSPNAPKAALAKAGVKTKKWRIDLILFINGLPIATLELKSKFKQAVQKMLKMAKSIQVMMLVRQNQTQKIRMMLFIIYHSLMHQKTLP